MNICIYIYICGPFIRNNMFSMYTISHKPMERECFGTEKLNTYVPLELNLREKY